MGCFFVTFSKQLVFYYYNYWNIWLFIIILAINLTWKLYFEFVDSSRKFYIFEALINALYLSIGSFDLGISSIILE